MNSEELKNIQAPIKEKYPAERNVFFRHFVQQ